MKRIVIGSDDVLVVRIEGLYFCDIVPFLVKYYCSIYSIRYSINQSIIYAAMSTFSIVAMSDSSTSTCP